MNENPFAENLEERFQELKEKETEKSFIEFRLDVLQLLADKKLDLATEKIVRYFLSNNHIYTTRDDTTPEVYIYNAGIYIPEGITYTREFVRSVLGTAFKSSVFKIVIDKLMVDTYIDKADLFLEPDKNLICLENGVYDLCKKELLPHSPEYRFFSKIGVTYNPEAECPNIDKFFDSVIQRPEDKELFYEIFGWCLRREYSPEKSLMLVGDGGNGKSKTLEILRRFLGVKNCCEISINDLQNNRFAMAKLHKKLGNIAGDIDSEAFKNTANFRGLTGRDLKTAEEKHKTPFEFENYAKMVFCANQLPKTYDLTRGFFRRWILYEFRNKFVSQAEYDIAEKKDFLKIADPQIIDKILNDSELSGLLNQALFGLERIIENKDFSFNVSQEEIKTMWIRKSDSFMAFCLDFIEQDEKEKIDKGRLRSEYSKYCKMHKLKSEGDKLIKETLSREYGVYDTQSWSDDGLRYWVGIKFKNKEKSIESNMENTVSQLSAQFFSRDSKLENHVMPVIIERLKNIQNFNKKPLKVCVFESEFGPEYSSIIEKLVKNNLMYEVRKGEYELI